MTAVPVSYTHLFCDINYTTATEDEQISIFERYCKFLNSLDCNYKITINTKNKNMDELRDKVLIAEKNDGFNNYRRIYNDIIEEKIIEGRQGICLLYTSIKNVLELVGSPAVLCK